MSSDPPEGPALRRALSLGGASAISIGLAFAAINFLGMAQLLDYVRGPLSWLAVLAGGLLVLVVRSLFSELNGMYPSAAGIRLWMGRAMNDRVSLVITLTYMTVIVFVIAADAFIVGEAMAYVFDDGHAVAIVYIALLLVIVTWLNLRGIKLTAGATMVVTVAVVGLTMVVGSIGILRHADPGPVGPTSESPVQALILGVFLYTAFEWVTANAEEVSRPRVISRAMLIAIAVLAASQTVFTLAMGLNLGLVQRETAYPQLVLGEQVLGRLGLLAMLLVTTLTAITTFSGGFVTLSRFMYALAREAKMPSVLARLNGRAVPHVSVILIGGTSLVVAIAVAASGSWVIVVSLCAALEMMIYAVAAYVVWRLRRLDSDVSRPFRMTSGRLVPVVAMVTFGFLALLSSVTVGADVDPAPLLSIIAVVLVVALYVTVGVPRLERRAAARRASHRAARTDRGRPDTRSM